MLSNCLTVTVAVALMLAFSVLVAVIVAVPLPTAVTLPLDTVATLESDVLHVTVLTALVGETLTVICSVSPTDKATLLLDKVILVGAIVLTVTVAVAFTLAFSVLVAVIVAVPLPTAVTLPLDTVATLELDVVHLTALLAPAGLAVTVRVCVPPTFNAREVLDKAIEVTAIVDLPQILSAYSGWSINGFLLP